MPVITLALSRPSNSRFILAAGMCALLFASRDLTAQAPGASPKPSPTHRPWPTLTPVSAGPNEVIHVVKKGDTLWDLAMAYLKDPFRWPEVFQRNTDIVENPHWIYPAETIRIP